MKHCGSMLAQSPVDAHPVLRWLGIAGTLQSLERGLKKHTHPLQDQPLLPNTVKLCSWPASPSNPSAGYLYTVHKSHLAHLWQP